MEENRRRWRGGREVPGAGGGKAVKWIDISGSASGPLAFFLYALTPSGVVYVLNLSNALAYTSGSVFHLIHVVVDVRPYLNEEAQVTCVTASPGFIFLGRSDGCVSFFQPFVPPQEPSSGFNQELRDDDDTGFLRRWGFVRQAILLSSSFFAYNALALVLFRVVSST
ncbi:hypothetical protein F2Q69_00016837 [Brassica cretica]|uniref:Uncharacterized protein n=1 Tax=Brassica cretica TaxID=69181 RepID=A0A8S9QY70_BRACR|nr:hypothetical protein F2Q69_00016837 [Brassica cretica]